VLLGLLCRRGRVDGVERGCRRLALLLRDVAERVAQQTDNAQLYLRSRKDRFDRLGKAFQPVDIGYQHTLDPAVLQPGPYTEPELRPFVIRRPKTDDFFTPLQIDADRQIDRAVGDPPVRPLPPARSGRA
jgi:hypothetical protein